MITQPFQQLKESASIRSFQSWQKYAQENGERRGHGNDSSCEVDRPCKIVANGRVGANRFCEAVIQSLLDCTQNALIQTSVEVIDWHPVWLAIDWRDLFTHHDNSFHHKNAPDGTTALQEVCKAILTVVQKEHRQRSERRRHCSHNRTQLQAAEFQASQREFHQSQLWSLQKSLLDVWMENVHPLELRNSDKGAPRGEKNRNSGNYGAGHFKKKSHGADMDRAFSSLSVSPSDRYIRQFITKQLTPLFLKTILQDQQSLSIHTQITQSEVLPIIPNNNNNDDPLSPTQSTKKIWNNILHQYTTSISEELITLFDQTRNNDPTISYRSSRKFMADKTVKKTRQWVEFLRRSHQSCWKKKNKNDTRIKNMPNSIVEVIVGRTNPNKRGRNDSKRIKSQTYESSDAEVLAVLLHVLDDIDARNLAHLSELNKSFSKDRSFCSRNATPTTECKQQQQPTTKRKGNGDSQHHPTKKRRCIGLPSNIRNVDIVANMHEAAEYDSDPPPPCSENDKSDDDDKFPTLYLGNLDRIHRAKKHQLSKLSHSSAFVPMKKILKAKIQPNYQMLSLEGNLKSTLTFEAVVLRRDLYRYLSDLDTLNIKHSRHAMFQQDDSDATKSNNINNKTSKAKSYSQSNDAKITHHGIIEKNISCLISTLVRRLKSFSSSPSMRLYTVIAVDSLREIHLGDLGYCALLNCLLCSFLSNVNAKEEQNVVSGTYSLSSQTEKEADALVPLQFYAEIVAECETYASPSRFLSALSRLMKEALKLQRMITKSNLQPRRKACHHPAVIQLLRAISHIMSRRHNILLGLHTPSDPVKGLISMSIENERQKYKQLTRSMSVSFDLISYWAHPTMPKATRERIVRVVQAEGILSLLCSHYYEHNHGENDGSICLRQSLKFDKENDGNPPSITEIIDYPFSSSTSLRSAHSRMGPNNGFDRLLSHPRTYDHIAIKNSSIAKTSETHSWQREDIILGESPFSDARPDVLHDIFSFLGYRSLIRALECCTAWRKTALSNILWLRLYFRNFCNSYFEEELANGEDSDEVLTSINNRVDRQDYAATLKGYDWKYMFVNKYSLEKSLRSVFRRNSGTRRDCPTSALWKVCSCNVIGCLKRIRNAHHFKIHREKHKKEAIMHAKRFNEWKVLHVRVRELRRKNNALATNVAIPSILSGSNDPQLRLHDINRRTEEKIDSPESVLRCLVFPFLGFRDVLQPICKLWRQLVCCNALWRCFYYYEFAVPSASSLSHVYLTSYSLSSLPNSSCSTKWKQVFIQSFESRRMIRNDVDKFGWKICVCPVLGCNVVLRSKFRYDNHLLKHEEKSLLNLIKLREQLSNKQE